MENVPDVIPCRLLVREIVDGVPDRRYRYRTPEGVYIDAPQVGDLFFVEHYDGVRCTWDNCTGSHLYCICPGDHWWNIDGRASNCTLLDERTHRCWVRHGDPFKGELHVDKAGHTCAAGAGSIGFGENFRDYHGFLHGFALRKA
jgi:hypothetical protein